MTAQEKPKSQSENHSNLVPWIIFENEVSEGDAVTAVKNGHTPNVSFFAPQSASGDAHI